MAPREKKDKDAPKNPRSSYIYFSNDTRAEVKKEDPSLSAPDVMRELGRRWKELSDEQKAPFVAQAVKDKKRYTKEQAAWDVKKAGKKPPPPEESEEEDEEEDE